MPTPAEPGESQDRPVLEPIVVLRPRSTDALAELFRELTQDSGGYEPVRVPRGATATEDDTQELPSVTSYDRRPARRRERPSSGPGLRRAAIAVGVSAAALVGFACALLLTGRNDATAAPAPPATTAPAPSASATTDPDGPGTLRAGDTGPDVTDLQERLRRIPNIYDNGSTDGRYDTVLAEAVARFQLWYGIRGDENGVYGDDTRRDLESRTGG